MPDADGKIKGFAPTSKTAAAWERIFGVGARTRARIEAEPELYARLGDLDLKICQREGCCPPDGHVVLGDQPMKFDPAAATSRNPDTDVAE